MRVAYANEPSPLDYFEPPEKRLALNIKVPSSLKDNLRAVVRLWKLMAQGRGTDPNDIDLTYVAVRLLRVGVDGTWNQVGQKAGLTGMPANEEEWARLSKALVKSIDEDTKTRSKK